jgi:hypothetical protein
VSKAEIGKTGVIHRSWSGAIPMVLAVALLDRKIVDASEAVLHQTVLLKLPVFVPIGTKPVSRVIVPLVSEANCDAVVGECQKLFDQAIVKLFDPLARQKRNDLLAAIDEL